jgi:hypothetical protein
MSRRSHIRFKHTNILSKNSARELPRSLHSPHFDHRSCADGKPQKAMVCTTTLHISPYVC